MRPDLLALLAVEVLRPGVGLRHRGTGVVRLELNSVLERHWECWLSRLLLDREEEGEDLPGELS